MKVVDKIIKNLTTAIPFASWYYLKQQKREIKKLELSAQALQLDVRDLQESLLKTRDELRFALDSQKTIFWYINRVRKSVPFNNIDVLARDIIPGYLYSSAAPGCPVVYGHYHVLKTFAGLPAEYTIQASVDHTAYWDVEGPHSEAENMMPVICMAPKRAAYLVKEKNRIAYAIGPFILYAEDMLGEAAFKREKLRAGKTLLVFPSHSNLVVRNRYDIREFIDYVGVIAAKYDSVQVCLYHEDIIDPKNHAILWEIYQQGYELVTAGSRFDLDYLSRLKSIIKLSDRVLTNSMGAYIGYAIALDRPVTYYFQPIDSSLTDNKNDWDDATQKTVNKEKLLMDELSFRLRDLFQNDVTSISTSQLAFVEEYWGLSHLKNRDEIRQVIGDLEKIHKKIALSLF